MATTITRIPLAWNSASDTAAKVARFVQDPPGRVPSANSSARSGCTRPPLESDPGRAQHHEDDQDVDDHLLRFPSRTASTAAHNQSMVAAPAQSVRLGAIRVANTIAIANQKGGVGKTTTARQPRRGPCRARGRRVLLVDLDPQSHLTINMGVKLPDELEPTRLRPPRGTRRFPAADVIRENPLIGVHYMPSNIELSGAETQLINEIGREAILKGQAAAHPRPGTTTSSWTGPPALSLITINAFVAADQVHHPAAVRVLRPEGACSSSSAAWSGVRTKLNPTLRVAGILPTIFKARTLHSREVLELVRQHFGDLVYDFAIKDSIRFAESPLAAVSILQYAGASEGAEAYRKLADAVLSGKPRQPRVRFPR